jgi:ribonucleoside-diphosphate reductase alpha chain
VPSILAAIGEVIEHHLSLTGFSATSAPRLAAEPSGAKIEPAQRLKSCPRCSQFGVIQQEGCDVCTSCGFSKCA